MDEAHGSRSVSRTKRADLLGPHCLSEVWEDTVAPAMVDYLLRKEVQFTILNPLRIGVAGKPSPPAFIMIGVNPDTLSSKTGIEVAVDCRSILLQNQIEDVHILVCESKYQRAAMYKPAIRTDPAAILREPFSTTVGILICNAKTSNFEGTGGLFFIDSTNPGILYLLTARHVLFHPDKEENKLYKFHEGSGAARRKVMLMGDAAFKARCDSLESIIRLSRMKIEQINRELEATEKLEDEDDVIAEREEVEKVITAFKELLATVTMDWEDKEKRVIGHVTLSPPLTFNHGADGFTDDWAVIEIHPSMISKFNFIGNAIDLGYVGYDELMVWMYPHPANPSSFNYPHDRLLRFFGTVSDQVMFKLDPKTKDKDTDPVTMVLKNGATSNLTVGRLNTIRAFTREYSKNKPGEMSKEVGVLPRNSRSGPFSKPGDSGSVVVDGKGRVCGILTGRDGVTEDSDCIFVTSINFIIKRLADFGIKANIFPLPADL